MLRYVEFRDANGDLGMIGQRVHGDIARDTFDRKLDTADRHLLHHVRFYDWTDVVAYDPKYPLQDIMQRANEIRKSKNMEPVFTDEDMRKSAPDFEQKFMIYRIDAKGVATPVTIEIGPDHLETAMATPLAGVPLKPDDPNNPLIKRKAAPATAAA